MHPILRPIAALTGPIRFDAEPALANFRCRELKRGELWLREGDMCRDLCFVETGLLRHTRTDEDGTQRTRWATLAGQFAVNFPSFTQQRPSTDAIEAAEPSVIHELNHERWAEMRAEHPQLQTFWVATLEYVITCFEDRVYSLISGDAERRYSYMMERYPDFLLRLPQHYVADMLGIGARHLSRVRGARDLKEKPDPAVT